MSEVAIRTPADALRERVRTVQDAVDWGSALYYDAKLKLNTLSGKENIPYGPLNKPRGYGDPVRRKLNYNMPKIIDDPTSYLQYDRRKYANGRKSRKRSYLDAILQAQLQSVRLSFKNILTTERGTGYRAIGLNNGLTIGEIDEDAWELPIHLYQLFNCNQGSVTAPETFETSAQFARVGWRLYKDTSVVPHTMRWHRIEGLDPADGTSAITTWRRISGDTTTINLGRKSLLDWTKVKLYFQGKTKTPGTVIVSLVKFNDEELCPETWTFHNTALAGQSNGPMSSKAANFWTSRVRPLVSAPQANWLKTPTNMKMKTLNKWIINFNPIDAAAETGAASDSRGHMKQLDIFNRWGRMCQYGNEVGDEPLVTDIVDLPAKMEAVEKDWDGYLTHPEYGVYLMIESVQPDACDDTFDPALTISYDINIEANHTVFAPPIA